jgi:spermidine synthase
MTSLWPTTFTRPWKAVVLLDTVEHFAAVRQRLSEGGIFCQWLPLYQLDARSLRDVIRTFVSVYPDASAWLAHFSVRMPMMALCARPDAPIHLGHLELALRDPRLQGVLGPLELDSTRAVSGS